MWPVQKRITLSHLEQTAYFTLVRAGHVVATPAILGEAMGVPYKRASRLLSRIKIKGAALLIGKSKYVILPPESLAGERKAIQDSFVVASQLMKVLKQDYTVAYASAAYLHGLLEQIPMITQIAVTQKRPPLKLSQSQVIRFTTVLPKRFFGISEVRYGGIILRITDLEKTVVDCLDRLDLCGGLDQAAQIIRAASEKMDSRKLLGYGKQMNTSTLLQRLGYLLEKMKILPKVSQSLLPIRSPVPSPLFPGLPRKGNLHPKWHLDENAKLDLRS